MSLILDALRKMEQERKARHGGTVDIRPAVLDRSGNDGPARNLPLLALAGAVLLLAGIGAGLLIKGGTSTSPRQLPADQRAAMPEEKPVTSAVPPPPPVSPIEPVHTLPAAVAPIATPPTPPRPAGIADSPAASVEPPDRGITISGIAWQDERGLRRAVVNGSLVGEGAEVAGARIIEIKERSVRFSRGDRSFEVSYSSAFPSR